MFRYAPYKLVKERKGLETPKEWLSNAENGIITKPMLGACIYSVNKRAKNCKDMIGCSKKKARLYDLKDYFLTYLEPVEVHYKYTFEDEVLYTKDIEVYNKVLHRDRNVVMYQKTFIDEGTGETVYFMKYKRGVGSPDVLLHYTLDSYSFHQPIERSPYKQSNKLPIIVLPPTFSPKGESVDRLISMSFVKKVYHLLSKGAILS